MFLHLSDIDELRKKWEEEMKAAMLENERQMREMKQSYEERLKSQMKNHGTVDSAANLKLEQERMNNPHLSNLNFDEQLSGNTPDTLAALLPCSND